MVKVATNKQYLDAFNDYLQENDLEQAVTDGKILAGQEVVPVNFDMFFGFLVDKIVLQVINSHAFIDKLDNLYGSPLSVGAVVEDNMTVLKSKLFDYDTTDFETDVENPYKKAKKGLSVCFHTLGDFKKIKVTVSYLQLKTGCLTENGINDIVNNMLNDIQVEYSAWAYSEKKKALTQENYVEVKTFEDYADFNIKLKDVKIDITNYDNSYKHNASLLFTPTSQNNIVIIMSERYKNKVDINYFVGLFNVEYAELKDNIIYIDEFDDPNIVCGLYDRRGFFFKKALDTSRELENGADLSRNRWLHFWRMHSVSPHYSAVVFREASESAMETQVELVNGYAESDFVANATITANDGMIYTTDGSEPTTSNGTYVAKGGNIVVTNPKSIAPVILRCIKASSATTITGDTIVQTRVRFEYPSNIDATLGTKRV